jgi:hypothetical protein
VGTSVEAEWKFTQAAIASRPDYEALNKQVYDTLIDEFAGPADVGVFRCDTTPGQHNKRLERGERAALRRVMPPRAVTSASCGRWG